MVNERLANVSMTASLTERNRKLLEVIHREMEKLLEPMIG